MPSDSHCGIRLSMSIIFFDSKYNTGSTLCAVATDFTNLTGDGRFLPAVNQDSLSVTQNSGSVCAIIANLSVITTSLSILYEIDFVLKNSVTGLAVSLIVLMLSNATDSS